MSFAVAGESYDRFMGRYSRPLAPLFLDFAGVAAGPVIELGCGPGPLTEVMASRFGPAAVAAVDPSEPFVAACRARVPGADVRQASAEALPFPDASFTAALSQLVLSFVRDAPRTVAEAIRVVRPGGTVAACTWDADGFDLARVFWQAALRFDPAAPDDARLPYRRSDTLLGLWRGAGLRDVEAGVIDVGARYEGYDDFWETITLGVGPPGAYLATRPEADQARIREACHGALGRPSGAFTLSARALAIRGRT
jgi:SAM-dependent methyltransferase